MLRRKQRKKFYWKLTPIVSRKLTYMVKFDDWSFADIHRETGIAQNRLSEIVNYKNYREPALNEKNLCSLLGAGMITMDELLSKNELTPAETVELETLAVCNDRKLREMVVQVKKMGKDPTEILRKALGK